MIRFCLLLALLLAGLGVQAHARDTCDFRLDRTKQFEATFKQLLLDEAEQARGLWQPIRRAQKEVQELARFVGRLDVCLRTPDGRQVEYLDPVGGFRVKSDKFVGLCTATLLPGNQLITARHCYHDDRVAALGFTEIEAVKVHFDFRQADFIGDVQSFDVSPVEVASVTDVDAMILKVKGDPNGAMGGHIPLIFQTRSHPRDALLMIHHPIAQPTQFSSGTCAVAREQSDLPDHAPNLRHMCETFGGSSGALILDADERVVVGLHQGTDVKPDARGRLDGFNIGFKFDPVNVALGLAFEPLNVVEGRLDGVLALRGLDRKRAVLEDVASRYPGTKVAARAAGMLQALPERDIDSEALAALEAAGKIADPTRRKAALDQVGRDFDGTQAARQAKRLLALMQPKQKTRDEHATDWLVLALRITDDAWQRALLESIVSEFDGTAAAGSAAAMLAKMAVAKPVPKHVVEPIPSNGPNVAMTVKQDGSGDFRTIADAVKAAKPGARIEIYPGTYQGGVDVAKTLDLIGIGDRDKIIWEAKDDNVIHWTAGSGRISNLSLRQLGGEFHSVNFDGGSALLENSDLTSQGWAIVVIHKGADPVLRGNVIHDGKQGGVMVLNKGRGLLEKNEIYGNALSGVSVKTHADPVLRGNVIRDGKQVGAMIYEEGRGLLEKNEIYDNAYSNVEIRTAADPVLRGNVIRGGNYSGVFIHDKGRGRLEHNEIHSNARNGVSIGSEADPELRGNVISGNTGHAIEIYDGGKGTIVSNDLRGNVRGAFDVEITAGDVVRRDNQE